MYVCMYLRTPYASPHIYVCMYICIEHLHTYAHCAYLHIHELIVLFVNFIVRSETVFPASFPKKLPL